MITTPRIGDSDTLLTESRTGVVAADTDGDGLLRALDDLDALRSEGPALAERCRRTAEERLSLPAAVDAFAAIYREIRENG